MNNARIVESIDSNNYSTFYVQKKFLFFWYYVSRPVTPHDNSKVFDTYSEALEFTTYKLEKTIKYHMVGNEDE